MKLISQVYHVLENNNYDTALRIHKNKQGFTLVSNDKTINKYILEYTNNQKAEFKTKKELLNFIYNFNNVYSFNYDLKLFLAHSSWKYNDIVVSKLFYTKDYKKYSDNKSKCWISILDYSKLNNYFDSNIDEYTLQGKCWNYSKAESRIKSIKLLISNLDKILKELNVNYNQNQLKNYIKSLEL